MARPTRRASSRRSRQVEQGMLGTHIKRTARQSSVRKRPSMSLSNKASGRAGEISHVIPKTSSRESGAEYAQRQRKRGFVLNSKKGRLRSIIALVALALAVLAIAGGVTWLVFKGQAGAKMHFSDDTLSAVLSAPEEDDDPTYVLVTGDFARMNCGWLP